MFKTRIYRIELCFSTLKAGSRYTSQQGPYTTFENWMSYLNGYRSLPQDPIDFDIKPSPEDDGIDNFYNKRFGFKDIVQLNAWFHSELRQLSRSGFKVFEYEVPVQEIVFGKRQLAFRKNTEVLKNIHDIMDIVEKTKNDNPFYDDELLQYFGGVL